MSTNLRSGRGRRRAKHRRRRRPRFLILLGCFTVVVELVLVTALPSPEDDSGTRAGDDETVPEPAPSTAAQGDSVEAEEPPVLKRSVVDEVDSASGDMKTVEGESEPSGDGPTMRYAVEVEEELPGDPADFGDAVEMILGDERSWGAEGEASFARVAAKDEADFTVTLAAPDTVDELCAPLSTNGRVSCSTGQQAIINQNRWVSGVEHFDGDLDTYRIYVINHEVGHVLGHDHVDCPGSGETAPIMQQQTLGLDGCEPNGWVNP